jgi:hypothetical protein
MSAPVTFESVLGTGAMINWITMDREDVPLYEEWYNYQHLPERVSTPGFLRGRRFIATEQPRPEKLDYLTIYETADPEVLASAEYLHRLDNPTELTQRVVPLFQDFRRAACAVSVVRGGGSSGHGVVVEVDAVGDTASIRSALAETVFPALIAEHRLHTGSFYEPDVTVSAAKNATSEGRSSQQEQQAASCVILAEMQTGVDARQLASDIVAGATAAGAALSQPRPAREFQLIFELRSR